MAGRMQDSDDDLRVPAVPLTPPPAMPPVMPDQSPNIAQLLQAVIQLIQRQDANNAAMNAAMRSSPSQGGTDPRVGDSTGLRQDGKAR